MLPLISVVTVCYNSEKTIRRTIESVLSQDISYVEYLIIDGASRDQTLQIISEYKEQFQGRLRIISEPDKGWYDAMNKGIVNSKGEFIIFLNSDDYFDKDAIKLVEQYIKDNKLDSYCLVYGDSTNIYMNSRGETLFRRIYAPDSLEIHDIGLRDGMCGIRHQSMFTGRKVFEEVGLLDLDYRLHADWDFLIRCIQNKIPMYHVKENLTFYSMYGASTHPNFQERHQLRKANSLYRCFDWNYVKDRWGIKAVGRKILGERAWNNLLFSLHRRSDREKQ